MSEQNRRLNEEMEDNLRIHIQGPISFDGEDTYIEVPADGEWHHIVFSGNAEEISELFIDGVVIYNNTTLGVDEVEDGSHEDLASRLDQVFVHERIDLSELLKNHPKIKSWEIKNNILYLEVEE